MKNITKKLALGALALASFGAVSLAAEKAPVTDANVVHCKVCGAAYLVSTSVTKDNNIKISLVPAPLKEKTH